MVVTPDQVQIRLSGGESNANPFGSLGGVKSNNQMRDDMIDSLFDPVSVNQRITGITDYYCIYIHNNSSTSQMTDTKIWFTVVSSYITMGLGTSPINGVEQTISPDTSPPAGINFVQPISESNALNIGILLATQHKAVWFRRIVPPNVMPTAQILTRFRVEAWNA